MEQILIITVFLVVCVLIIVYLKKRKTEISELPEAEIPEDPEPIPEPEEEVKEESEPTPELVVEEEPKSEEPESDPELEPKESEPELEVKEEEEQVKEEEEEIQEPEPEPIQEPEPVKEEEPEVGPGTFTYVFGGSECSCTPSEKTKTAERRAARYRSPIMKVSETVQYKIETPEGYDVSVNGPNGKKEGTFTKDTDYVIYCAALEPADEKIAKITLSNSGGTKIIYYRLYNPNFSVTYKNDTGSTISDLKCIVELEDGTKRESTYPWQIGAGKSKSDAWIDKEHSGITKISGLTLSGKTVTGKIEGLGTKEIIVTIG